MSSLLDSLLAKSPVRPLQEHMALCFACIEQLDDYIQASSKGDWALAQSIHDAIIENEKKADETKNTIRTNLPSSLLLPFARSDVIALLTMQDKLANRAKEIAVLTLGRKLTFPESLQANFYGYFNACKTAAGAAKRAIDELDDIVQSGFGKTEYKILLQLIEKLDVLEEECNQMQVKLRADIMPLEAELPPINVMFLYNVVDLVGEISNVAERIGNRLLILVSK
ncbi:MAG: TIGR00153 family protein [Proteobacteria bacterium]|jgi:predicted phosphate transport protein (TIGR00153 family)|nr:TIGR00153 family protein [Pseudomonadota bacterium]